MKKLALLVLDSQKLELNIPLKGVYDFFSSASMKSRFSKAVEIAKELEAKGWDVKIIALDSRTEDFLKANGIKTIDAKEVTENLYDLKYGEASLKFLRDLINKISEIDDYSTYRGILLPELDEKNLWRTFVYPAVKSFDLFEKIIKKYRPAKAVILNNGHFYQKIFRLAAGNCGVKIEDKTKWFAQISGNLKKFAIKNMRFAIEPQYLRNLRQAKKFYKKESPGARQKILIAHDTISPAKIIPWAKKLAKKYDVVYAGVREKGAEFEKEGIKYKKLQDYTTAKIIVGLKDARKNFEDSYEDIAGNINIIRAMSFNKADISSCLDEMMLYLHYISYAIAATYVELFNEMLDKERPDLVITVDELSRFGRALIRVANDRAEKTLIVQHGALFDHPLFDSIQAEKFAAYGEQTGEILLKRGATKAQVEIVGQAEEMPKGGKVEIRQKICKKLGLDLKKPVITFASQALPDSINYPNFEIFYGAAAELPELQFAVKLHPDEQETLHNEFIKKLGLKNVKVAKEINTGELLVASDIVVNIYSTVGMEALSFGKPLISLNANLPENCAPKGKGAYIAESSKGLKNAIKSILSADQKKLSDNVKKLSKYYIKATGEVACENVAKLIDKILE